MDAEQKQGSFRFEDYFILFSQQIERSLKIMITVLFICLILVQLFLFSNQENQALVNKAIQYEGVYQEDRIELKPHCNVNNTYDIMRLSKKQVDSCFLLVCGLVIGVKIWTK